MPVFQVQPHVLNVSGRLNGAAVTRIVMGGGECAFLFRGIFSTSAARNTVGDDLRMRRGRFLYWHNLQRIARIVAYGEGDATAGT